MYLTEAQEKRYVQRIIESIIKDYILERKKRKKSKKRASKKGLTKGKSDDSDTNTRRILTTLKKDDINTAALMRKLYHPKDKSEEDTYRSLMSKCINGKRKFTPSQLTKLDHMISEI